MSKFCVSTDSGCDLPAQFCSQRDIRALHMKYTLGEIEYVDRMEPSAVARFYEQMRKGATPRTSQIAPFEFVSHWSKLLDETALPIVHISMGSAISGTFANALVAKSLLLEQRPNARLFVVDSTLASIGYGILCVWAADMRDEGKSPEDCAEYLERNKLSVNTYYTTDDLKYLHRSGRVNKAGVIVATALNINPILNLDSDGYLVVREKVRGRRHALNRIYDIVGERVVEPGSQTLYICHSDCKPDEVKAFSDTLMDRFGFKGTFINFIGPTIGSHSGPGLIAAFFTGLPRFK